MGKDLYDNHDEARRLFEQANDILGFRITDIMFSGTDDELKQTKVTQPAIFLHSVISAVCLGDEFQPSMAAGHSLGEFSALTAVKALSFEEGLTLVSKRAMAMQRACELQQSTMAAVLGGTEEQIEEACKSVTNEIVVAANYNCPGQIVISGTPEGIRLASEKLAGIVKRIVPLNVGGAFHSPLMEPARIELAAAIEAAVINTPLCPVYQNVDAKPHTDPAEIKANLLTQLTAPVRWTQSVVNMIGDGADEFVELGPGNVLSGLIGKIKRSLK
jgi:[acyl-carrier-protein] S-malonyltransferase